jgi:hypothetical protein
MHNAPHRSDIIRGKASQMVRAGEAPDFHTACVRLGKRAAKARIRRRDLRQRTVNAWWNK